MEKVKVWDRFVRLFHWGLALLVLGSFVTADHDAIVGVHARIGLAVLALVVARVVWGVVGSRHARFGAFVRGPREVASYARAMARGRPPHHLSHNPLGGAMVVAMIAVLLGIVATGAIVYAGPRYGGPLTGILASREVKAVKEVHEALGGTLLALIAVHVIGVLVSSLLERQNLVAGMITGWKRALQGASEPAPSRWRQVLLPLAGATAIAVGAAAAIGVATLIGVPHAAATTAAPPMPPRPERPTVRGDVDERIERHCGALMGRECTAEEKRRFPKFLLDS